MWYNHLITERLKRKLTLRAHVPCAEDEAGAACRIRGIIPLINTPIKKNCRWRGPRGGAGWTYNCRCCQLSPAGPLVEHRVFWSPIGSLPPIGVVHAWVGQIVTFFAYSPPSRPLRPGPPHAYPAREGHQPDSGLPWGTLGSPSGSVLAARA